MDEEFDTSIDTSSFDDVTPNTSDVGSFDDASDIVSVMDEAMDTSSFEVSEDLDTSFTDTSEDVASIMDDVPSDMDSIEELNIEDTPVETDDLPLETESEIENLMDDTEGVSSEIGESELSDITGAEFAEELPEQTDIGDVLDEAATDIEPETSEMPESEFSELAEQDSSEIESLMDEAALDNTSEDAEIMNEGETYDIPHDEISDIQTDASENESSEIEDLMNETEPVSDDIEESTMDEGETYDIPHDEEISESLSETDDGSEIFDLMDIEETPEITEEESLEAGADLPNDEVLVEDVGDNVPENEEIEQTDLDVNRGPDDFETSPETLENPSQYETVGEFAPSEPGNPEAWDMSDVPSFEEHMNEIYSQTDAEIESSLDGVSEEPVHISQSDAEMYLENATDAESLRQLRDGIESGRIQIDTDAADTSGEIEEGPALTLTRDTNEQWEIGNNAIDNTVEAMRDDLRDKGLEDGPEMESIVMAERARMQDELRRNIEGDFSDPYVKPDFNEILENRGLTQESEGISENIEPPPENIQDVIENIDYNQAFEGLDSYDFDGINYSDNPERLDASLDSFQSDRWENLSIDEQKDAMNGLAEYVEDVIGFENPPEIVYYNNPVDGDYGGYSAATNTLEVNEHMLYENEEAADTIAHELWHAYQHERAENPTSTKDYLYQYGFDNYVRPEDDFSAYQDQLVEAEARAFAQQFKDRLNLGRRNS